MQALIKFIASGSSSATGNFAPGDLLRCGADHARHFVEEARCAVYADSPAALPSHVARDDTKPAKPRRSSAKDRA